jgi:ABC-type dipeptide/oligopeptide/nickel transport system permease component/ABC-type transport system substrate-binding protein
MNPLVHFLFRLGGVVLLSLLAVWGAGWVLHAIASDPPPPPASPTSATAPDVADDPDFDPAQQLEAPALAQLVQEQVLPPLASRLPTQPLALQGPDGPGRYGGTWFRAAVSEQDLSVIGWRLSYHAPLRWSGDGRSTHPHVALGVEASADHRRFVVTLREGHRWSDGQPFTADDVMYWWNHEVRHPGLAPHAVAFWLTNLGDEPSFERIDEQRFAIRYERPNPLLPDFLASFGYLMFESPRHYLEPYHPDLGDPEFLARAMAEHQMPSPEALYQKLKDRLNPEHPRLWPWVATRHQSSSPYVFTRNPYYFAVDELGRQLPYLDQVVFSVVREEQIPILVGEGRITLQARHVRYHDLSSFLANADSVGLGVLRWTPAAASDWLLSPNRNRRVDADDPASAWKAQLLGDPAFLRAMSLSIDRREIIEALYSGQTQPAQAAPPPGSPFHDDVSRSLHTDFDPDRARQLLDGLGLVRPDGSRWRAFPDGSAMVWFVDYTPFTGPGPSEMLVEDWADVGLRVIARQRARALHQLSLESRAVDFAVWTGESEFNPLLSPRQFVPFGRQSHWAVGWGTWNLLGGLDRELDGPAGSIGIAIPPGTPAHESAVLYRQARMTTDPARREDLVRQMVRLASEHLFTINVSSAPPQLAVRDLALRNVPDDLLYGFLYATPGNGNPETFFFVGGRPQTTAAVVTAWRDPGQLPRAGRRAEGVFGRLLAFLPLALLAGLAWLGWRYRFVGQRLLIMAPTLLVLSILVFTVVQLPPSDFLSVRLLELQESGTPASADAVGDLREMFHFDEPGWKRYLRWSGLHWFTTFSATDKGLLQGDLGRSMATLQPVNAMVGDRLLLTVAVSLGTILLTWGLALPVGIYSAAKQYSWGDYFLTTLGFLGMCIPPFLLALLLMAVTGVSGLFSPEYAIQPGWSVGKVIDLLKHLWLPVVVLGVGGTAGMIRVMRANLLDELRKPYVTTSRAKGNPGWRTLLKYPTRIAINPFVSNIGLLFPQLISGGAIVAIVLSLPTIGPLLLESLFNQDTYLAGSLLMVLSVLGLLGTLVSDLLLLWLDPRVRYTGGTR